MVDLKRPARWTLLSTRVRVQASRDENNKRSNCTLFCLGVQFVPRDLLHIPNSRKIFNVRMKVFFGEKSLSSLFRILRQDPSQEVSCDSYCFTTAKGAEIDHLQSTCVLMGLKDVQRFSLHLLLVSFGHCRLLEATQVSERKDKEVTHKFTHPRSHSCASFGVSLDSPKTCSFAGSIKLC